MAKSVDLTVILKILMCLVCIQILRNSHVDVITLNSRQLIVNRPLEHRTAVPVQLSPSPLNPFVFLHSEKTGGSSLRDQINAGANNLGGLRSYIPCFGHVPCPTFDLDELSLTQIEGLSVVAGHFDWGVVDLIEGSTEQNSQRRKGLRQPVCFTSMRDPVERFISYYYDRVYKACRFPLRDATADDVQWIFDNFAFRWGKARAKGETLRECMMDYLEQKVDRVLVDEGASNPATKTLAGMNLNKGNTGAPVELNRKLDSLTRKTALRNVDRCVVGIMEQWENTVSVLGHWFPWIPASVDMHEHTSFVGEDKESALDLSPDVLKVIRENNEADMELYEYGLEVMQQQLWDMAHQQ